MADPLNGLGSSQTAIVNPFQKRNDQVRAPTGDQQKSASASNSFSLQRPSADSGSRGEMTIRGGETGRSNRAEGQTRGTLFDAVV